MLTVRNALRFLTNDRLRDLCRDREVVVGGNKEDLVTRLVREYSNNMEELLQDLSAEEMVDIALASFSEDVIRSFVLAASRRTRRPPAEPIQLYSTGAEGATNRLGLPALDADAKRASRTTIISAYYAPNTLEWLFSSPTSATQRRFRRKSLILGCGEA